MVLNAFHSLGLPAAVSSMYSFHAGNYSEVWRYWDLKNIWNGSDARCIQEHTQPWLGSLEQVAAIIGCHGASAKAVEASASSPAEFRNVLIEAFSHGRFVTTNFDRKKMNQEGFGHHSPIGAYDEDSDRVLVLDVARYKYPPWWADLNDMFAAMQSSAPFTNFTTPRGYIEASMPSEESIFAA
eukprot:CAMPEP_0181436200 /NCGR_PEP_ID=MMETSP1110-20121109/20726_1 /TAXON_ID=174948 /ORGANISM="Symbiodinium sp., Strain CCMP421" /LENGTH=182 /DNA_ID=CAMNT_0023559759 /DNA_START=195 /DNA_END=743 /DNA_ORIENTATION=+